MAIGFGLGYNLLLLKELEKLKIIENVVWIDENMTWEKIFYINPILKGNAHKI